MPNDQYWKNNYNTPLSAENETRFNNWVAEQSKQRGRDLSGDLINYDLRGYWLNEGSKDTGSGHMPDTYKKPNHDTFSNESKYNGASDPMGGKFQGGKWLGDDKRGWSYQPSDKMLTSTHTKDQLERYFAKNEPDVKLLMPFLPQKIR